MTKQRCTVYHICKYHLFPFSETSAFPRLFSINSQSSRLSLVIHDLDYFTEEGMLYLLQKTQLLDKTSFHCSLDALIIQ